MFKEKKKKPEGSEGSEGSEEIDKQEEKQINGLNKGLKEIEDDLQSFMEEEISDKEVEIELARLEKVIQKEKKEQEKNTKIKPVYSVKAKKVEDDIREILPLWIEKPIYWITPGNKFEKRKHQWTKEWAQLLIAYTDTKHIFVIIVRDLINEFPFKNPLVKKQLKRDQLIEIGDHLVEEKRANWLDPKKTRLFVGWQTRNETSEDLYLWAQEEGRQFLSIFELMEDDYWNTLPEEEIKKLFALLVREDKAIFVDSKEKNSIRFEFRY